MILEGGFLAGLAALLGGALLVWFVMNLIGAVIVGAIARFLLPGADRIGWPMTILVGFLGGFVGNIIGHLLGWIPKGPIAGFLGSIVGAMVLLLLYRFWTMRKGTGAKPA